MSNGNQDEHFNENDFITKENDKRLLLWLSSGTDKNTLTVAECLNEKRAQFSQKARDQALGLACKSGRKFFVQTLLAGDANLSKVDADGNTPLLLCAERGHADIAEILITKGADINFANSKGETPLMLAILPGRSKAVVGLLLKRKNINIKLKDNEGATALLRAIHTRDMDTAALLYALHSNENAYLDATDFDKKLIWKIEKLQDTFTLDEFDGFKQYPIVSAANMGVYEVMDLLCISGADVNLPKQGKTALHVSIEKGRLDLVELLIKYNADINILSKKKKLKFMGSALYVALYEEKIECAKLLLSKGAHLDLRKATLTAVTYQKIESLCFLLETYFEKINSILSSKKIRRLLRRWIKFPKLRFDNRSLLMKALSKPKNLLELIIRCGEDVNKLDEFGQTPLYVAVTISSIENIRTLIQNGAGVNFQQSDGRTPLMEATTRAMDDEDEIFQCLIEANSNLELQDDQGNTALMLAVERYKNIELFLKAGANVNQQNKRGDTPLTLAIKCNQYEAFDLLCKCGANMYENFILSFIPFNVANINEKCVSILLDQGADTSSVHPSIIHKLIMNGQCSIIPKLVRSGLAPVEIIFDELNERLNPLNPYCPKLQTLSPFTCALINNEQSLAEFFASNWFLTSFDIFVLPYEQAFLNYLYGMNYAECLRLLDEIAHKDFSLTKLSFIALSPTLGSGVNRIKTIQSIELRVTLKNKLLFEDVIENKFPGDYSTNSQNNRYSSYGSSWTNCYLPIGLKQRNNYWY